MSKKRILFLSITMFLLFFILHPDLNAKANVNSEEESRSAGTYIYPSFDTLEWKQYTTAEERIAACRIPKEILEEMTEEQLVQAVYDFPLLCNALVFSDIESGVRNIERISDAYAELPKREGAKDALLRKINQEIAMYSARLVKRNAWRDDVLAALILYQEDILMSLSEEELGSVASVSSMIKVDYAKEVSEARAVVIRTPQGSPVAYIMYDCKHDDNPFYHEDIDSWIEEAYNVECVSRGTCKYNCHSYAWYSRSSSNAYWIPDPSIYMTDGSYKEVMCGLSTSSIDANLGDIVYYGDEGDEHSAVLNSSRSGEPLATRAAISKWGATGVFKHSIANTPYGTVEISAWHKN